MYLIPLFLLFFLSSSEANEITFKVTDEVIQSDIEPFTATIPAIGNGSRLSDGGGFEPIIFRTMFQATKDAKNTIYADAKSLTFYDSWREGLLDGASIEVLRIENGKFRSVRRSTVKPHGHLSSGWIAQFNGKVISANINQVEISLIPGNNPDANYYYSIRTVDNKGGISDLSNTISATPPVSAEILDSKIYFKDLQITRKSSTINPPVNLNVSDKTEKSITLSWNKVPDAEGYIVYRSDYPPSEHKGYALVLSDDGPQIKAQDLVIIRHKLYNPTKQRTLTNRVWNDIRSQLKFTQPMLGMLADEPNTTHWQLVKHPETPEIPDAGETYLSAEITPFTSLQIGKATHSGTGQQWYEVFDPNKSYTFEIWLRGEGEITATANLPDKIVQLPITNKWQKHTHKFTARGLYADDIPRSIEVNIAGDGHIDADNFRLFRSNRPYLALIPEDFKALKDSGMGYLRTHGFVKTFQKTYDLSQLTNTAGAINGTFGNTLPQILNQFEEVGTAPWLQIEPHFSGEEWLGLVEFLAAPYDPNVDTPEDKPWAAKRYLAGHEKPYTNSFQSIRLELGNETWNWHFAPWIFPDMIDGSTGKFYQRAKTYGLYQEYVLTILKRSPYWELLQDKLQPVIGGWTINSYGETAAAMSPSTPLVTVAEYNGGWDQDEEVVTDTPKGYASLLSFAPQTAKLRAEEHVKRANIVAKKRGTPLIVGTYEAGPGYVRNGLNNAKVSHEQYIAQEQVMKSVAAGTATLDTFLTQMREGYKTQNFFLFKRGDYWSSHAQWYHGGQPYPAWQWLSLLNNNGDGLGDLLKVEAENVPTNDLPKIARRKKLDDAAMIDAFAFKRKDVYTIVVISRIVPGNYANTVSNNITITLPTKTLSKLKEWSMTGDYSTNNTLTYASRIFENDVEMDKNLSNHFLIYKLKPGSVRVYEITVSES